MGGIEDMIAQPNYMLRTAKALPQCKFMLYSHVAHSGLINELLEETVEQSLIFLKNLEENDGRIYKKIDLSYDPMK